MLDNRPQGVGNISAPLALPANRKSVWNLDKQVATTEPFMDSASLRSAHLKNSAVRPYRPQQLYSRFNAQK
jgi:hypothetical protein